MDETTQEKSEAVRLSEEDLRRIVEGTTAALGVHRQETEDRTKLERELAELKAMTAEYRSKAEATERASAVREELRKLGVTNVELGYRAVREDVVRREDGALVGRTGSGEVGLGEFLARFVETNPELVPARRLGGSGSVGAGRLEEPGSMDLDTIRPGMDPAEMERARREVARLIGKRL